MSIHWQTGEPPCGKELLIEYKDCDNESYPVLHAVAARVKDTNDYVMSTWRRYGLVVLRWSTLDDAPDALGRLEAFVDGETTVKITKDGAGYYRMQVSDRNGKACDAAKSLAAAIEQLCGGTDAN